MSFYKNALKMDGRKALRAAFLAGLAAGACLLCASAWASGGGGGHEKEIPGWVLTDSWRVLNFAVLAAGLFWIFRKVGAPALKGRIEGIEKELKDLEAKKTAAKEELASYEERLGRLEAEAESIVADYVRQGEDAKGRILAEAEKAAARLQEQAKRHMDHEFNQAKTRLREEILERAVAMGEEVIKQNINKDDQERLVNEYLEKVVTQ